MHGVDSSRATQIPQIPDVGPHIPTTLFSSPPSTPLVGSHDVHPHEATQPGSRGGDRDEADDLFDYIFSFLESRCVTNTGTLPGTFIVNKEGLPLKQVRLPGNF